MASSFRANDNRGWTERFRIDDSRAMNRDARSYRNDYARPDREGLGDKRKRDRDRKGLGDKRKRDRDRKGLGDKRKRGRDRKGLDDKRKHERVRHNRPKSHSGKKQKADSDFGQGDVPITRIFRFLEETSETEEAEFDFALSSLESFSHTARQTAA